VLHNILVKVAVDGKSFDFAKEYKSTTSAKDIINDCFDFLKKDGHIDENKLWHWHMAYDKQSKNTITHSVKVFDIKKKATTDRLYDFVVYAFFDTEEEVKEEKKVIKLDNDDDDNNNNNKPVTRSTDGIARIIAEMDDRFVNQQNFYDKQIAEINSKVKGMETLLEMVNTKNIELENKVEELDTKNNKLNKKFVKFSKRLEEAE